MLANVNMHRNSYLTTRDPKILILRGHIRNSFQNNMLKQMMVQLIKSFPQLQIYIHTWNVFSNGVSWRHIAKNENIVTPELIKTYFGNEVSQHIHCIMIDDDSKIKLEGRLEGNLYPGCLMPIRGWKNYWYGKRAICCKLFDDFWFLQSKIQKSGDNQLNPNLIDLSCVISCRFDIFSNSNSISYASSLTFILNFFKKHKQQNTADAVYATKNIMALQGEKYGADNLYGGSARTMFALSDHMHTNLDAIVQKYLDRGWQCRNQEFFVVWENDRFNFTPTK